MRYSHRFFLYAPLGLLLLLAAIVMIYWKLAADSFSLWLIRADGHEIMPGVRLTYASQSVEGFPFRLDSLIDALTLEIETSSAPIRWRTQHFATHMLDYERSHEVFESDGTQTISWTDSAASHHETSFVPGTLRASAIESGGGLARFDLDIMSLNSPVVSADRLQFHIRRDPARDELEFALLADRITLACPSGSTAASGELTVQGQIVPAGPFRPMLDGRGEWRDAYSRWLQSGGRVAVEHVDAQSASPSRDALETCVKDFLQRALAFAGRP